MQSPSSRAWVALGKEAESVRGRRAVFCTGKRAKAAFAHSAYPHYVSIYQLPAADLARGKAQCRIAIRRFADALAKGQGVENWPGYTLDVEQVGLTNEYRRVIDEHGSRGDAAFINAVEGE